MSFDQPTFPSINELELVAGSSDEIMLVRQASEGDFSGFQQIVQLHTSRVFNFVFQMTRHRQDAEDLVQQTFIKAYRNLHRFDGRRPIINWLLTIARRSALNHFRSSKRWEEMPESTASNDPSPAAHAEHKEQKENLWAGARRLLSERQFAVLWLRYGEDLSIEDTARVTGLTQAHIKIIVFRARNHLMKLFPR
jgi:RNA polymerase sigma-70 factor (ECF subfamily)